MVELGDTAYSEGVTAPVPAGSLVGQTLGGRYRVTSLLGSGGMGAVYRAEHIELNKTVALKVLNAEMAAHREAALRFEREAMVSAKIQHPHVVNATDSGRLPDGSLYLVLEYVAGRSLRAVLDAEGRLPPARALAIGVQIADALGAAHRAEIVHRDLKPGNIMLLHQDGQTEFVKVLDFGLARVAGKGSIGEPLTRSGSVFGTPEYMSPEQARGEVVDHRSDLYALGIILYEMLGGRPPFQAPELVAVLIKHLQEQPSRLPSDVPAAIADYVMSLLDKVPARRPADARQVAKALRKLGPPQPLFSTMPPRPSSAWPEAHVPWVTFAERSSGVLRRLRSLPLWRPAWLRHSIAELAHRLPTSLVHWARWPREPRAATARAALLFALAVLSIGAVWALWPRGVSPQLAERARLGEPKALGELSALPASKRNGSAALALGTGYAASGQLDRALDAFSDAIEAESALVDKPELVAAVRRAADDVSVRDRALEFAATRLGRSGADVLFDVWVATNAKTPATRAARKWLDSPAVRAAAGPGVVLALESRVAKTCSAALALLPRMIELGDERSLAPLRRFQSTTGCGFLDMSDCYPCLRGTDSLDRAVASVAARPAPKLGK